MATIRRLHGNGNGTALEFLTAHLNQLDQGEVHTKAFASKPKPCYFHQCDDLGSLHDLVHCDDLLLGPKKLARRRFVRILSRRNLGAKGGGILTWVGTRLYIVLVKLFDDHRADRLAEPLRCVFDRSSNVARVPRRNPLEIRLHLRALVGVIPEVDGLLLIVHSGVIPTVTKGQVHLDLATILTLLIRDAKRDSHKWRLV